MVVDKNGFTENYWLWKYWTRLYGLNFKSDNTIRSKTIKYLPKKNKCE